MQCKYAAVDPLVHREFTDTDKAQPPACALHAHVDTSGAAVAKRTVPSLACATPRQSPAQHQRSQNLDPAGKLVVYIKGFKWEADKVEDITCSAEGRLAEVWLASFSVWIAAQKTSDTDKLWQRLVSASGLLGGYPCREGLDQGSASLPSAEQVISFTFPLDNLNVHNHLASWVQNLKSLMLSWRLSRCCTSQSVHCALGCSSTRSVNMSMQSTCKRLSLVNVSEDRF